jgi:hypothetical protein
MEIAPGLHTGLQRKKRRGVDVIAGILRWMKGLSGDPQQGGLVTALRSPAGRDQAVPAANSERKHA